ncbi:Outer membrane protein assembly factor BamB precursor [Phycisphaerae bacterium RAS1]|nr:Outer membrane protein assembly factor BamB precursor [Phycisphaerae bacterium RAS1]
MANRYRRKLRGCWPAALLPAVVAASAVAGEWTHLARDARRSGVAARGPRDLSSVDWCATLNPDEEFVWRSSVVVGGCRAYANVRVFDGDDVQSGNRLIALHRDDGQIKWRCELPPDVLDSISTPTISAAHELAILGIDQTLFAVDTHVGSIAWQRPLPRRIVNASAAVSDNLKNGETPANRVFITDYAPYSTGALYAVNLDAYHASKNPFQPGEIAWSVTLAGSSGATPALDGSCVYVACTSGEIRAYDARDGSLEWAQPGLGPGGFFGGVGVSAGAVYAATYNFFGSQNNSRLYKLSSADGAIIWQTPCERTTSIPVVVDSRIYVSGGINGFGSVEKVQAFADGGTSATLLWDTAAIEPTVGGWTHQPACADGLLYVGTPAPGGDWSPYVQLAIIDTLKSPGDAGFIMAVHPGSGGSPALADGAAFSFGSGGLFALAGDPLGDMNCDGAVDVLDINPFVLALFDPLAYDVLYPGCNMQNADANGDEQVNVLDINAFVDLLAGDGG